MNLAEAEAKLRDYIEKGLIAEIFWAESYRALAVKIGDHSDAVNASDYRKLCGMLQTNFSERETLAVAKIYDPIDKRYPTRSILAVLSLIKDNLSIWRLHQRHALEDLLSSAGWDAGTLKGSTDEQLISLALVYYMDTVPDPKKSQDKLSASLVAVRESRSKAIAHNEAIELSARKYPSWSDTKDLIGYAKEFVSVIAFALLGISMGPSVKSYHLSAAAQELSGELEQLLTAAKLI
jgi:hypothetical protein